MISRLIRAAAIAAGFAAGAASAPCASDAPQLNEPGPTTQDLARRLTAAYRGLVTGIEGNDVIFADGTRLPLDDGKGPKNAADWLDHPDIKDMFRFPYPAGAAFLAAEQDFDPGRAHNEAFFTKVYGNCRKKEVEKNLVEVVWLPKRWGAKLRFSRINGAAGALGKVSAELDQLSKRFNIYLFPTAGTYNCRVVAGTKSLSAHSLGIAIDISLKRSAYWRWDGARPDGTVKYTNRIPLEIINIFEKHGFIWGGRWYHYDTMHFEYRPELMPQGVPGPE